MKIVMRIALVGIGLFAISCASLTPINERAMYGKANKNERQLAADAAFISEMLAKFGSREEGSRTSSDAGWEAFNRGEYSLAMSRFNQAWLLDENNPQAYWGFGLVLLRKQKYKQGLQMLEDASMRAPENARLISDLAHEYSRQGKGYGTMGGAKKNRLLGEANKLFAKACELEPDNAKIYTNWAISRFYHRDYQDAWRKVTKVRALGEGRSLPRGFIKSLNSKWPDPLGD